MTSKPPTTRNIAHALLRFMDEYPHATRANISRRLPIYECFASFRALIEEAGPVSTDRSVLVTSSLGQGRWATIPWLAIRYRSEGAHHRVSEGPCVAFLFRADMTAVNLCLTQGTVARWERAAVAERAIAMRTRFAELVSDGFSVDDRLDLASERALPKRYQEATVAYKVYAKITLPSDHDVERDLTVLLATYRKAVGQQA